MTMSPPKKIRTHQFIGLDGEGKGRAPHVYTYMGGADRTGRRVVDHRYPTTLSALEAIAAIPKRYTVVTFSFLYDLTKILADLPNESLYKLFRPETRQRWHYGARRLITDPVKWHSFELDWCAGRFSVKRTFTRNGKKVTQKTVVWDLFKFFACSFVNALTTWGVGGDLTHMTAMKAARSKFDELDEQEVIDYCLEECKDLAELAHRLYDAHIEAGLYLKGFYGAGSTSGALLTKLNVKEHRNDGPEEMRQALASGFFGGRFEIGVRGTVERKVYNYDISSAYPYQCTRLPCLACGNWKRVGSERVALRSRAALIHAEVDISPSEPWAPLPFRTPKGEIAFPHACRTWVWAAEYQAAKRLFPQGVRFVEAWHLRGKCICGRPTPLAGIAEVYRERVKLGKEGKGMVLKLGSNGVYGKLAQSIGSPQFQSWVWAGMITSGCRGQLLDMIALCKDRRNVLMCATDGILVAERLTPPKPWDTGTFDLVNNKGQNVPLGGWEEKTLDKGVCLLRPGVYFPNAPTPDQLKEVRARGLGRSTMTQHFKSAQKAVDKGVDSITFPSVQRFIGAVSGIYLTPSGEYLRSPNYGEWVDRETKLSFSPLPKRELGIGGVLLTRNFRSQESHPYDPALVSPDAEQLQRETIELLEQPESDYYA